jgi:aminopeptidase N
LLAALLPFAQGHAVLHETTIPPYTFIDTVIRVHFDFARGIVYGEETATVRARRAVNALPFDSVGIHYTSVTVNGQPAQVAFDPAQERILVHVANTTVAGTRMAVTFRYWSQPQRGVYFIRPDHAYPNVSPEIWTQGETTDNRRWFPTWDEPNDKTPNELIITVPSSWMAIANGTLRSRTVRGASATWDWVSPHPKSTYLIAFAAGAFSELRNRLGTLDVDSYVPPQDAAHNDVCFRDTPRMIAYYQQVTGFKYPFAKYDQVAVERFTFGGMENASVTILTDSALHPAVEDVERNCDHLVSHELAQQWFGDDVTMADWSNEWINEGFATYFDELWTGHHEGEAAFEYTRHRGEEAFFGEAQRYLRPIVDYRYNEALDLFDVSGHERAAAVLHMLRYVVGDKRFFAALHSYLAEYQYRNADTTEFFASIERFLHDDLGWFESEWFHRASYPHYVVSDAYNSSSRTLNLTIRQENPDGKPFRMPVAIEVYANGAMKRVRPWIDRNEQTVSIGGIASAPKMILFDPNENLLRELTFPQPINMLAYQVIHAAHVGDREWALAQLATAYGGDRIVAMRAVAEATLQDPFYGVRADGVQTAAALGDEPTVLRALRDRDPRVRIAAEEASARLSHDDTRVNTAIMALTRDENPDIAGAAIESLGARRAPGAYALLTVATRSSHQTIASKALLGLAAYGDARAMPLLLAETAYGVSEGERNAAVGALATLARSTHHADRALPALEHLVTTDPLISTRLAAAAALGALGDARAVPALSRAEHSDSQAIVRIEAWSAIQDCRG